MHSPTSTEAVKEMFNRISPTYDLLNALLSMGVHRLWSRIAVGFVAENDQGACLDLCTGTGALIPLLAPKFRTVTAADISPNMLRIGRESHGKLTNVEWVEANALQLPFNDSTFDATTVAYGVRNWPVPAQGLAEVLRVTKPGGELVVLEFGQPSNPVWRWVFGQYSRWIIPFLGRVISGDRAAYSYLPETSATFPCGVAFEEMLTRVGWVPVQTRSLMGGIAYVYLAKKQESQGSSG